MQVRGLGNQGVAKPVNRQTNSSIKHQGSGRRHPIGPGLGPWLFPSEWLPAGAAHTSAAGNPPQPIIGAAANE